jgi:hypothetical protein
LLAQAQNDDHQNHFGWGLRLRQSKGPGAKPSLRTAIERGFIDNRWPTQTDVIDGITKKATTYVKNGRLIQAVAIGSRTRTLIDWTIGGLVHLGERQLLMSSEPDSELIDFYGTAHHVQTSTDGYILSVTCESRYCLDIQLFNNGVPLSLRAQGSEQQRRALQYPTDFVDIRRTGRLELMGTLKPRIFVAVFSFRDRVQNSDPTDFVCPKWEEIRERLWLPGSTKQLLPPIMNLEKNEKIESLSGMEDIITRNVVQLLFTTALPSRPQPMPFNLHGFIECSPKDIDYAATL